MMAGQMISIDAVDGGSFAAYLALPESGSGPGIVVLQEIFGINANIRAIADYYAEEGYVALAPDLFWRMEPGVDLSYSDEDRPKAFGFYQRFDIPAAITDISATVKALKALPACTGKVGALGYCLGGALAVAAAANCGVDCAVAYYGVGLEQQPDMLRGLKVPVALHFGSKDSHAGPDAVAQIQAVVASNPDVTVYVYPGADHGFAAKERKEYDKPAAMMAHSRSIALFRKVLGPHYDLSALWDKHCEYEFGLRDVPKTMATMVAEPYVNHVPTLTGGVGYKELSRFYKYHFVDSNPADTKLIPISRTVGADRLVDEMLFCFTHDREIDWMLPGVKPTGKYVEVALLAVICFRGDKLYNEHIYWDQASVLVQIGLLDPKLYPVAGIEASKKLVDETLPSNELMARWSESEPAILQAKSA
jgi:carboxymethylenebutenolidase